MQFFIHHNEIAASHAIRRNNISFEQAAVIRLFQDNLLISFFVDALHQLYNKNQRANFTLKLFKT